MSDEGRRESGLLGAESSLDEVGELLERAEFGVLGLASDGQAYTVPLSFGYDEELTALYFMCAFEPDSKKRAYMEATETATFVVADSALPDSWASIFFEGTLARVPEDESEDAYAALAAHAAFPASYTFAEYIESYDIEQALYEFEVDRVTTRRANAAELDE